MFLLEGLPLGLNPARRENFITETKKLGLDPAAATLFDWLDADDKASYTKTA